MQEHTHPKVIFGVNSLLSPSMNAERTNKPTILASPEKRQRSGRLLQGVCTMALKNGWLSHFALVSLP